MIRVFLVQSGLRLAIGLSTLCLVSPAGWSQSGAAGATDGAAAEASSLPPQPSLVQLRQRFDREIAPLVRRVCGECHSSRRQEAKLDLLRFREPSQVETAHETWQQVLLRVESGEMPPEDSERKLAPGERQQLVTWIRDHHQFIAARDAGDPGAVLVRRLNNAEYDYTIRDLTGVDIRPTREFPIDPANEAGFDNSGESLSMSPALLTKYLAAARHVVDHLLLPPTGLRFAPHPVATDTDRDKYAVKRIVQFYERQPTDYAAYFLAAWELQMAGVEPTAAAPPDRVRAVAQAAAISPRYLGLVWKFLSAGESQDNGQSASESRSSGQDPEGDTPADALKGPATALRTLWARMPTDPRHRDEARHLATRMRAFVLELRDRLHVQLDDLEFEGHHKGSQPFVLWKNRQYAELRRAYHPDGLKRLELPESPAQRAAYLAELGAFCSLFPDAFYISERGRDYVGKPREQQEKGRLLSAGFHSMMGYFRDDQPLYDLILDAPARRELDRLWEELDVITSAPFRQYTGFVWFERTDSRYMRDPEFDFARAEDHGVTSTAMIRRLAKVYLDKAHRNGATPVMIGAIEHYFRDMDRQLRRVERLRREAEPSQLEALLQFADRAYRRPLTAAERQDLQAFYRQLRDEQGLTHAEALQDALVSVLLSPHFCYRLDLASEGSDRRRLEPLELASRLSYFLWSSMPDEQLRALAESGQLSDPATLKQQARRMLRDPKAVGFATEFGGNWLDFRRFQDHNSVDRERFPSFTDSLREAMFQEPIRYFQDLLARDGSVRELLTGQHTFVNRELAEHYGVGGLDFSGGSWQRLDRADRFGRGGLLPMGVFLTHNSPGLRTSPVKRGYWVVRRLLGERIPPPPPNVPELPADERQLGPRTLRETLEAHREHKSCAACHDRFDSLGLAFEGYGPIGQIRQLDLAGRPVETSAVFPGGHPGTGLAGLKDYLSQHRQDEFLDNLAQKLLAYALGRRLLPSDTELLERMRKVLETGDDRFGTMVEAVVTSSQFLEKRS